MTEPTKRTQDSPAPARRVKPLREQLHEAVNSQLTDMAERGFAEIDNGKNKLLAKLEQRGVTGMEQIADTGAQFIKALIARGISK